MPTEPTGTIVPAPDTCAPDQVLHLPSGTLHLRPVDVAREHPVLMTRDDTPIDQLAHLLGSLSMAGDEAAAAEVMAAIPPTLLERAEANRRAWRAAREADRELTQRALAEPVGAATLERQAAWRAWLATNEAELRDLERHPAPVERVPPFAVSLYVDAAGSTWPPSVSPAGAWRHVVTAEVGLRLDPVEAGSCFDAPGPDTLDRLRAMLDGLHRLEISGDEVAVRRLVEDTFSQRYADGLDHPA